MESPVRLCIGAALVVNLLLLSGTLVNGIVLPHDTTPSPAHDRTLRYSRNNETSTFRNRAKFPDISINELKPKDSTSEDHTEKNAKYKDRGRITYFSQLKSSTESPLRRIRTTELPKLKIITPTVEVKKPVNLVDSMNTYKRTELPIARSTIPVVVHKEQKSEEEIYEDEEDEEEKDTFEKFSPSKFYNFFTIPSYNDGYDYTRESDSESSDKVKKNKNSPNYGSFSSFFPEENSYGYKDTTHDVFKSESFFSFDSDLTTPKNDFFDKKFQRISSSITKNLDDIKTKASPANATNIYKIVQEKVDMEKVGNNTPSNKSSVFIKNTKEIRLLDNDSASSANKELSDVQGTSIYYEMTVLSTETYGVHSDDDCDNESLSAEPTVGTSSEEELVLSKAKPTAIKAKPTIPIATKQTFTDSIYDFINPVAADLNPKNTKQAQPHAKSEIKIKTAYDKIKPTLPYLETDNYNPATWTEERGRIKSTVPNIHVDSFKTTSSSARQENKKSRSSVSAAGSKTLLSTLRSKSVRPILLNTSAEGTKSTIYETAKPTTNFRFKIENPTIPYPVFDSTINPIFPSPTFEAIKPTYPDKSSENESILSLDHILVSSVLPMFNSLNAIPVSTQNIVSSTERAKKIFLNNNTRNRTYSKRPNMNGNKDSPNSVTPKPEGSSTQSAKTYTRKYYHSITKPRPIWMPPRKNDTKSYAKPTYPTTIYSEHFSIKDKYKKMTTVRPKVPIKTVLTTISSDIDPVLEIDASGAKKVVHSQSLIDNTVPGLWKRGSTKFGTSASNSSEKETETELPIPPTSTMWALASLLSIPHFPNITNGTKLPQKGVSENNLQEVVETMGEQEITTDSSAPTTANPINNDILVEKVTKLVQNKLSLQPMLDSKDQNSVTQTESQNEIHSETLPAESIISVQSSSDTATTEPIDVEQEKAANWMPDSIETEQISMFHSTKGFESITKLPSDVTTPLDETDADSEINESNMNKHLQTTTDYAITTIRFSYIPTEEIETETQSEEITPTTWHPVFPTRTKITYVKEIPITTYRPQYITTTEMIDESTIVYETTPRVEVSSQVLENSAKIVPVTTAVNEVNTLLNTAEMTTQGTTSEVDTQQTSVKENTEQTTDLFSTELITTQASNTTPTTTTEVEDTTTIVVEVVTEINTEREQRIEPTTMLPETTEIPPNELHDTDCTEESSAEIITEGTLKTTITETTTAKDTTTHATETSMTATTAAEITTTNRTIEETTTAISTTEPTTKLATYRTTIEIIEGTTRIVIQENVPELSQSTSEFQTTSEYITEAPEITQPYGKIIDTTLPETTTDTNYVTKSVSELEDLTSYSTEVTTQASSIILNDEDTGSGAAVAIAVSTIGVIALILLIGLLLVVRRRGRRGVYAQRCTPVSLDAYSLDSVSVGHRKGNQRLRASKRSYGNPAYDDEVTSHPMNYPALANFALDMESMTMEFSEIPSVTVKPDEVPPGCEDKNRYSNVLPLPETRVPLRRIGSDATTEYINANYVTGPGNIRNYYIACQAPLSSTVVDFWRMIWEQNSRLIVMLTEYMENGVEKCYEYLPPSEISDNRRTFGDFKIILKKREQHDKYAVSSVQLVNTTTRTWREITQLWYFWPAKGVPEDYDSVIDFLCEMRTFMKISQTAKEYDEEGVEVIYGDQSRSSFSNLSKLREEGVIGHGMNVYSPARAEEQMRRTMSNNGTLGRMKAASEVEGIRPCVVTCASGAGRSAAVIALDICARALPTSAGADVPRVVRHLRAQRPHSLTNRHHYIFIYKVLSEYGNKMLGGGGVDSI